MTEELQAIVIDNGSGMIKAGFAGDEAPQTVIHSIVGRPKNESLVAVERNKDIFIGDEACSRASSLFINYPIKHGVVSNWYEMENILNHIFNDKLKVDSAEHAVLLAEPARIPDRCREKMAQLMFETFNVPFYYTCPQGPLSLYSSGRTTGIVCEVGDGLTQICPVYDNYIFNKAVKCINFGGRDLSDWLQKILCENGYTFTTSAEKEIVRDIKEKTSYIAQDYDAELHKAKNSSECDFSYVLPNGDVAVVNSERFNCPELLFKPNLNFFEFEGIYYYIYDSILKSSIGARKYLCLNIVLSGGTTMINGFAERIEKEIINIASPTMKMNVIAPSDRKYAAWIGGSIIASLDTFPQKVITHDEYNDYGASIVHRKCL